jgi:hypothetical protein
MCEIIQLSKFQNKSTALRLYARKNKIPVVELRVSDVRPADFIGYPTLKEAPLGQADKDLVDECEEIFLEHYKMTGKDLRDPDGCDWMLDERDI